jgi:protoheme IX farnesyltransferase
MLTTENDHPASNLLPRTWAERAVLLLSLGKMRISLLAAFTAAMGQFLASDRAGGPMVLTDVGVLLLAMGSCSLNQYQEREIDARMQRTRERVLPSKRLNPRTALAISVVEISLGSFLSLVGASPVALILGLFAVLWYNGVYTYLKRKTAFATLPGALIGAIPPAIGWVSGGGSLLDPRMWQIGLFFCMWQIPHFWFHLLDFGKDYEAAGLPSMTRVFSAKQLKKILFIWLLSTGVSCLLIPLSGFAASAPARILLLGLTVWLFWTALHIFTPYSKMPSFKGAFIRLNLYVLGVTVLLSLDRFKFFGYTETGSITGILAAIGFVPM